MQLTLTLDGRSVQARLASMAAKTSDLSTPLTDAGDQMLTYYGQKVFEDQGIAGESWEPLSERTVMMRARHWGYYRQASSEGPSSRILVWTGNLMRGFYKAVEPMRLEIGNGVDYFKYHQQGGRRMLALTADVISLVKDKIYSYFANFMIYDAVTEIQQLLQTALGSTFASYFAGDPGSVAKSDCPALIVMGKKTSMQRRSTAEDLYKYRIIVRIVVDTSSVMQEAPLPGLALQSDKLCQILMEGSGNGPSAGSVMGVLNKQSNIRGTFYLYNFQPSVDYEPNIKGMSEYWYKAADLTMDDVTDIVVRTQ